MIVHQRTIEKLARIEGRYAALRYEKVADVAVEMWETREHFRGEPETDASEWTEAPVGTHWGDSGVTAWFRGDIRLPEVCRGQRVFVGARTGGETLFFANGVARGVFDEKHPVVMLTDDGAVDRTYHLAFEAYAGHSFPGTQPDDAGVVVGSGSREFGGIEVLLEREDVTDFVFSLHVLRQLLECLDENSLRRGEVATGLQEVFEAVDARPSERGEDSWRPKLRHAQGIMDELLAAENATSPEIALIGHSHIDTAWLWPIAETWRKCARTFSSALSLMEQYPEFIFLQPAPCHAEVMGEYYPDVFERMQEMAQEGRWEPNGAMWVEPDCNVPSGEALVRQCLFGQQATREMFGRTSDTLWLPDVFGYSAALPQILKGCGVDFFCTSKISWNDTTRFPYDTFEWQGIDGTCVLAHYTVIQGTPDPATLTGQWNWVQHTDVQDRRLFPIGYGDGGGGPTIENLEMARRVRDVEGCPRTQFTTVSDFMTEMRDELTDVPRYVGELYLEGHRGTLTSIARIKRLNRKAEVGLRQAEFLATVATLQGGEYPRRELDGLWKRLLTNQFHDILPGSSIAQVNDEAIDDLQSCVDGAAEIEREAAEELAGSDEADTNWLMLINSLSWERTGELGLAGIPEGMVPADLQVPVQRVRNVWGDELVVVGDVSIPALGSTKLKLVDGEHGEAGDSPFTVEDRLVETPFARVEFDDAGRISSFIDKQSGNEVVAEGGRLNSLLLGEDEPLQWDNWDIDLDHELKMEPQGDLVSWEVIADGPVQLRIRAEYEIGDGSRLTQEIVFHSSTPRVDFETVVDWSEKHKLLKAAFELNVLAERARHEIQYGHVERPTHRNLPQDRARFEVCAHKWTDMSERRFGIALLDDCKYGIGVRHNELRLTLLKSGTHPDARGDAGTHDFTYCLLPHNGFSVPNVVRPAYELNIAPTVVETDEGSDVLDSLLALDADNVIVESIKAAEEGAGFVVRLYEAEKTRCEVSVEFGVAVESVSETNMLEEDPRPLEISDNAVHLQFTPFEIKTLLCEVK